MILGICLTRVYVCAYNLLLKLYYIYICVCVITFDRN